MNENQWEDKWEELAGMFLAAMLTAGLPVKESDKLTPHAIKRLGDSLRDCFGSEKDA